MKRQRYKLTDLLRDRLDTDRFLDTLLMAAYTGEPWAVKLVLNYTEGLPVARQEHQQTLEVRVIYEDLPGQAVQIVDQGSLPPQLSGDLLDLNEPLTELPVCRQ